MPGALILRYAVRVTAGRFWIPVAAAALVLPAAGAMGQQRMPDSGRALLLEVQLPAPAAELRLEVTAVILAAPASEAALPVTILPEAAIPAGSFVRIRGLPPTAALTEGHTISPGAWAVPIAALKALRIVLPAGLAGKRDVTITLVTSEGAPLAEARTSLVVAAAGLIAPNERPTPPPTIVTPAPTAPAPAPPVVAAPATSPAPAAPLPKPAQPAAAPPQPPLPPAMAPASPPAPVAPPAAAALPPPASKAATIAPISPAPQPAEPRPPPAAPAVKPAQPAPPKEQLLPSPEALQRARQLLARGQALMKDGDIASARLFFQRAAEGGSAEAALAMGGTFDAAELARQRAHGIRADAAEARRWYERAVELGSGEAADRLKRLGAR